MPITEKQRASRAGRIGSSDVPAILGVDRWRNPMDVYLEKKCLLEPKAFDRADNQFTIAGTYFESAIANWFRDHGLPKGHKYRSNIVRVNRDLNLKCHIDGGVFVNDYKTLVAVSEIKTSYFYQERDEWGDFGTDQVPMRVWVQGSAHMIASGTRRCYVPVFLADRGIGMFIIEYRSRLIRMIIERLQDFSRRLRESDPPPVLPSENIIKYRKREPGTTKIDYGAKPAIAQWDAAKSHKKHWERAEKDLKAALLDRLGDNEFIEFGDQKKHLSFSPDKNGRRTLRVQNKPKSPLSKAV